MDTRIFRAVMLFFLACVTNSDKFLKIFCSSCGGKCPLTANFCHRCGQQLNLSQVSNKAARPVDKGKLLKEYFHWGYPYAAIVSLLEKRHGIRIHVRTLERKLNKKETSKRLFAAVLSQLLR